MPSIGHGAQQGSLRSPLTEETSARLSTYRSPGNAILGLAVRDTKEA